MIIYGILKLLCEWKIQEEKCNYEKFETWNV